MDKDQFDLLLDYIKHVNDRVKELTEMVHQVRKSQLDIEHIAKLNGVKLDALGKLHGIDFNKAEQKAA